MFLSGCADARLQVIGQATARYATATGLDWTEPGGGMVGSLGLWGTMGQFLILQAKGLLGPMPQKPQNV